MQLLTRRGFCGLVTTLGPAARLFAAGGIDNILRSAVAAGKVPAVTAVAGDDRATFYSGAFGTRDADSNAPVKIDSIFAIASMTKAITSVAAMQLVERGGMTLDEPAARHVPELANLQVLDGFDPGGKPLLRRARTPVTLRQLLTHTSGFAYDPWHEGMSKLAAAKVDITHVLAFEPGTKWQYGPSTMWAGRMVEAVSGQNLEQVLQKNILGPLEMKDTTFVFPREKFDRLVGRYQRDSGGSLKPVPRTLPQPPSSYRGDGGLYSTAPDYLKFTQMILRQGTAPAGERVLQAKTVAQMSANGTGNIAAGRLKSFSPSYSRDVDFHPGHDDRYTLGFLMNPDAYPGRRSAGSLAWAGLYNTYYWIDPHRKVTGVILMQFLPFADESAVELLAGFETAVYDSRTRE